jgi:lysine biosynthesis protein LysW
MWECMECSEENELDPDAEEGQIIECSECGSEYEIVRAEPLSLAPLSTSGDDDGDGDWDD